MDTRIAVLVPAYKERKVIGRTLEALFLAGVAPADIFIVDDASDDGTSEVVRRFESVNLLTLERNRGKAEALNAALEHFQLWDRYTHITLLDADSRPAPNYFQVLVDEITAHPNVAIFVGQVMNLRGGWITAARAAEYGLNQAIFKLGQSRCGVVMVAPGCSSTYLASALRRLRFSGATLAEDMHITIACHRMGGEVRYVPKAKVFTQDPSTLRDYIRQVLRWYYGGFQVYRVERIFTFIENFESLRKEPIDLLTMVRRFTYIRKQRIDALMMYLVFEALAFSRITLLAVGVALVPSWDVLWFFPLDAAVSFVVALWFGVKLRRADVVYKFPMYFWVAYLNHVLYLWAMYQVMWRKKTKTAWAKVKRY